jgi:hypothetical protein
MVLTFTRVSEYTQLPDQTLNQIGGAIATLLPKVISVSISKTEEVDVFNSIDAVEGSWRIRTVAPPRPNLSLYYPSETDLNLVFGILITHISGPTSLLSRLDANIAETLSSVLRRL